MLRLLSVLVLVLTIGVGNVWGAVQSGWTRVTTTAEITAGGTFIIGYEATANTDVIVPLRSDGANATTSAQGYLYSGTTKDASTTGTIDMSSIATTSPYEVTIAASSVTDGAITIQMATGNYIGTPPAKNTAKLYTSATTTNTDYTVAIGANDVVTLTNVEGAATQVKDSKNYYYFKYFRYNTGSGTQRFAHYRTGQADVVMYKKSASCTEITPSLSYASVGGTTLTVGSSSSGSPTVSGNTGSGAVTYSVTAASPAGCATVNGSTGVVTAVAAGTATITASIAANGGYCSGSATANFTITVPAYTVQFSTGTGNPTVSSRTEASGGAGITLPAGPTPACSEDGWTFIGWKETSACSSTTTAPDLLAAGSTYKPTSNCTLYAVYYKLADSNPNYFTKVTSSSANLTSGYYVIYANGEAMNNVITSNKIEGVTQAETSSGSGIISTSTAAIIWIIYKNGTNYQLYNAAVGKYLEVTGENQLALQTSSKGFTLKAFNTSTGQVSLQSVNKTSYQFQYYNGKFSSYGSQSVAVFFYKRSGTYNSNPTCCTELGSINGSFFWTTHFCPVWPAKHRS